jgi:hypothetical protein
MYFNKVTPEGISSFYGGNDDLEKPINGELFRFHDPVADQQITIRLASDSRLRNDANRLLNRMYSWRGYGHHHEIAASPSHSTFTASSDDELIGTITLAVDSPDGLAADELFKDVIDDFRVRPDRSVCELTKFAFETNKPSKPMLASLFHLIFIYGQHAYGCTDVFIEVNPRHVRFYEHMLGFKRIGALKDNVSVAAPAQLMWLSVAHIREQIDKHAGRGDGALTRSLYAYFFSPLWRKEVRIKGLYTRMVSAPSPRITIKIENRKSTNVVVQQSRMQRPIGISVAA